MRWMMIVFSIAGCGDAAVLAPPDLVPLPGLALPPSLALPDSPDLAPPPNVAPSCGLTIAGVDAGDFTIRFQIRPITAAVATSNVLFQRAECSARFDFWDVDLLASGQLRVEVGEGGRGYATLVTLASVDDRRLYDVVVHRGAGVLSVAIDGALAGAVASPHSLGALPPLGIARGGPCEGHGKQAFVGYVSDVCLTVP